MFPYKNMICLLSIFITLAVNLHAEESPIGLAELEKALAYDFTLINYPPPPSIMEVEEDSSAEPVYHVAIIGAGMSGLAAGAALFKEGIFHIKLFDQNPEGLEGPWLTYARMKTLRSGKDDMGPALGIPHLTFHAWYEAQYGTAKWNQLDKIPTSLWMDYLVWFKHVMHLPVENECQLVSIIPEAEYYTLEFICRGKPYQVKALKVVLATGRGGFGGPKIPDFVHHLPKKLYAHVMEFIEFNLLKNKKIGVLGVGSSAFDAAAEALEKGAAKVDLIMRSPCLPCINKFASLPDHCFRSGYYKQSEEWRWKVMSHALICTVPPPIAALNRVRTHKNFAVQSNVKIISVRAKDEQVELETNQGILKYDFLILGTGYDVNANNQPELHHLSENILLWKDRLTCEMNQCVSEFGKFPYLGPSFELLEKEPGKAAYLKNLYCFNYASLMSHGMLSSDIGSLSLGAIRLAEGIAADFLQQQSAAYLKELEEYAEVDFDFEDYLN